MRLATALFLLNPAIPMLFMGEEFGATTPFLYFSDWQGDLKTAVTEGRRREFAQFSRFADPEVRDRIPDPCSPDSFERSRLDRAAASSDWLDLHARLLRLRRDDLVPRLPALRDGAHESERFGPCVLRVRWAFEGGPVLQAVLNLGGDPVDGLPGHLAPAAGVPRWHEVGEVSAQRLGAWSGAWWWSGISEDNSQKNSA